MGKAYAVFLDRFWTGSTGKKIVAAGKDPTILATYLFTNGTRQPIGLYYLPLVMVQHQTPLTMKEIGAALKVLADLEFAFYDAESEFVWVPSMAAYQISERLDPEDKRVKWVRGLVDAVPEIPFKAEFLKRYGVAYHIRRSPFEGPSEALKRPMEGASEEVSKAVKRDAPSEALGRPIEDPSKPIAVAVAVAVPEKINFSAARKTRAADRSRSKPDKALVTTREPESEVREAEVMPNPESKRMPESRPRPQESKIGGVSVKKRASPHKIENRAISDRLDAFGSDGSVSWQKFVGHWARRWEGKNAGERFLPEGAGSPAGKRLVFLKKIFDGNVAEAYAATEMWFEVGTEVDVPWPAFALKYGWEPWACEKSIRFMKANGAWKSVVAKWHRELMAGALGPEAIEMAGGLIKTRLEPAGAQG